MAAVIAYPYRSRTGRLCALLAAALLSLTAGSGQAAPAHAIAMHGQPALGPGFEQLRYANPNAPKGGRLAHGVLGTFDSLNPFVVKGLAPTQIRGYVIESLMARGYDEPFTLYGLLAETVETDAERSFVTFNINPAAKFSDGKPVTAADVIFSWQLLRDKGRPNFRTYYAKVVKAEALGERAVRFDLTGSDDRELPLILGLMPVLAKHATNAETFEETTLAPILGSGPYVISDVSAGHRVTLKRDPNYWGRKLGINRGFWNFDEIRYDFYRDANTHFEAFKKGLYDVRPELDAGRWETGYDSPALRSGRFVKESFPTGMP
jgi:peptide/nickel transport system substrate-binding protein